MAKGDIKYVVTADTKKGKAAIREFDEKVDKLGKTTKTAAGGFKTLAAKVAVGVAAFYAASKALQGLIRWTGESIKGAIDAEKAEKKLEVVLKSTADAAGLTKDELVEMAKALQAVTTYEDDVIMGAEHLLLTFTNIGKEVFPEALETVLNMSQAMGTDLRGASIQLGKALQDPILGATALRRVGVNLSRSMMEQIKVFVESGNIMGAQRLILAELATEFGGTARAVTDTFGGSLIQLKNTFRELQDEVGETIIHNEDFKDLIKETNEAVRELIDSGAIRWFTDIAIQAVKSAPMLKSLSESLALVALIYKIQTEEQGRASESMQEWFKYLKLNDELQQKLRKDIAEVIVVTEEESVAIRENIEVLETQLITVRGIRTGMTAWGPEILTITEFINGLQDAFYELGETALPAARDVSDALGLAVSSFKDATIKTEKYYSDLGETSQAFYMDVAMSAAEGFAAILSTLRQWAIAEAVKYIFAKVPFPASLIIAALAAGAIGAFFNTIKSMETGGTIEREGIYHLHPGEVVTPASRVNNIYNQTTGGARAVFNINVTTTRAVNAEQLFRDMQREAKRHGYKL